MEIIAFSFSFFTNRPPFEVVRKMLYQPLSDE